MAFFSLQQGNKVYVLNKESVPHVCVGTVVSVTPPKSNPSNWQQMAVTVIANIDGVDRTFENLPSDKDMADSMTGLQLYCDREMLVGEVRRMQASSAQALADIDKHKAVVSACDGILAELCPEIAEKAAREQELEEMKAQMAEMREMFRQMLKTTDSKK